jgi:uncharacterized coiled-coil protein SlyX
MTIQYIMLVLLGFLAASLLALLLAPAFWSRAVRLTTERLKQALPLSESEILADKDQLRAKYAMRVHQLEKQVEQASLGAARQKIELNRRDANISNLEAQIGKLQTEVEENQNARRVLEQTVADRIPKIEARLEDARKLLTMRDREIADLTQTARRQQEALADARAIGHKQAGEVERLKTQLMASEAQSRRLPRDADFEGQLALRGEIEQLRTRVQDQASLIDRLNAEVSSGRANRPANGVAVPNGSAANGAAAHGTEDYAALLGRSNEQGVQIEQLRSELAEAKAAARGAGAALPGQPPGAGKSTEQELRALRARAEDQGAEITRLRAELATATAAATETEERGQPSLRDSRVALKARLSGLEAKATQQSTTIQRLRSELAAANERSARQAAQFMEEMRKLGTGGVASRSQRSAEAARSRATSQRPAATSEGPVAARTGTSSPKGAPASARKERVPEPAQSPRTLSQRVAASSSSSSAGGAAARAETATDGSRRVSSLVDVLKGERRDGAAAPQSASDDAPAPAAERERGVGRRAKLLDRLSASGGKSDA